MGVYIIAGQSNALGISPAADLKERAEYKNVLIYQSSNVTVPSANTLTYVRAGLGADESKFGLELGIAKSLAGENAAIIKYASDGTSLYDRWTSDGEDRVNLFNTYREGISALKAKGCDVSVKGFFWMQGENDACTDYQAAVYYENLKEFIVSVREVIGQVYFVIGETNPSNEYLPYSKEVNEAKRKVANELRKVLFVPTCDLKELCDNYHYNADNMLLLGERMANALKEKLL